MKLYVIISLTFATSLAARLPGPHNIVGGRDAKLGEVPWIVDLHTRGDHFCAGSILDKRTIITAAHCMNGKFAENITVHVGSLKYKLGGTNILVSSIIPHQLFNKTTYDYDIALMKLASDLPIDGKTITAVNLPPANSEPAAGQEVLVAGWGTTQFRNLTYSDNLKLVTVNIVSRSDCQNDFYFMPYFDRMICAGVDEGGKDACQGDSGGPLTHNNTQVGIVSNGIGCAEKGKPGIYTRVSMFIDWINEHKV